jgi:hypothetical protein
MGAVPTVEAQELATSLEQLRVLVKLGDSVRVTDGTGQETRGTIAELASASLTLVAGGNRRAFLENDIRTIRQRRPDSLSNGAKWGFGIGAGLGLLGGLAVVAQYDGDDAAVILPTVALLYGGIGAGVGVGIDAMITGTRVIYARPAGSSARRTISPLVTPSRKGVLVSLPL